MTREQRCTVGGAHRSVRPAWGSGCVKRSRGLTLAFRRYRRSQLASARLGRNDASVLITAADRTHHVLPRNGDSSRLAAGASGQSKGEVDVAIRPAIK